jgi:hypothetical protein
MLPILRRRPSRILVAVLCALLLSRMPAPVFGEDATSTIVKVEESAALSVLAADSALVEPVSVITILIQHSGRNDAPNLSLIHSSILRL